MHAAGIQKRNVVFLPPIKVRAAVYWHIFGTEVVKKSGRSVLTFLNTSIMTFAGLLR